MSVESDLQAWLLADPGVAAAINDRLHRLVPDAAGDPYAVMTTLTVDPQRTLQGPTGESIARLQIVCWGTTLAEAESARDAIRAALRALERAIIANRMPAMVGGTRVRDVAQESDQELYEDEVRQPRRLLEVTIRYEE